MSIVTHPYWNCKKDFSIFKDVKVNMKSYDVRNKNTFLRNSFYATDQYDMPFVYKQDVDLSNLIFIGFQNTKLNESKAKCNQTVHFFIDDYKYEAVWNQPNKYINKLSQYKQVLSPDFSLYTNMPMALQVYNTFRRRWCSAFWQAHGLTVIPSKPYRPSNQKHSKSIFFMDSNTGRRAEHSGTWI